MCVKMMTNLYERWSVPLRQVLYFFDHPAKIMLRRVIREIVKDETSLHFLSLFRLHFHNVIHDKHTVGEINIQLFLIGFRFFAIFKVAGFYLVIWRLVPEISL